MSTCDLLDPVLVSRAACPRQRQHDGAVRPAELAVKVPATPAALLGDVDPAAVLEPSAAERATGGQRAAWLVRVLSFGRFVLVGGVSTGLTSVLFLLLGAWMPATLANTLATIVTTVGSNQAHARWTFSSGRRGAGMHLRAGISVAITYPVTTLALFALERMQPGAGAGLELLVLLGSSAVAGLIRYLLLLVGVFPDSPAAFGTSAGEPDTAAAAPVPVAVGAR